MFSSSVTDSVATGVSGAATGSTSTGTTSAGSTTIGSATTGATGGGSSATGATGGSSGTGCASLLLGGSSATGSTIGSATGSPSAGATGAAITGVSGATPELSWPIERPKVPNIIKQTANILFMVYLEMFGDGEIWIKLGYKHSKIDDLPDNI